jgi:hypothetical protein
MVDGMQPERDGAWLTRAGLTRLRRLLFWLKQYDFMQKSVGFLYPKIALIFRIPRVLTAMPTYKGSDSHGRNFRK